MSRAPSFYGQGIEHNSQPQTANATKFATLSPYMAEIQKRKKARSVLKDHRSRSKNQSSSKSFRIKEKSTTSLHDKDLRQKGSNTVIANILGKINARKNDQSHNSRPSSRSNSKFINQHSTHSHTIRMEQAQKRTLSRNSDANDSHKRGKKQLSFRKNMYQTALLTKKNPKKQASSKSITLNQNNRSLNNSSKQTLELTNYGYTENQRKEEQEFTFHFKMDKKVESHQIPGQNLLQPPNKKKFRKGKYEQLYSSVTSNDVHAAEPENKSNTGSRVSDDVYPHGRQYPNTSKSENMLELGKKESNASIYKQIDLEAEREIKRFYRQMRSKEIQKSLEKSTEKYFKESSNYRLPKTKNDIEIYVSTVKNPSVNRQSNATKASTIKTSPQRNSTQNPTTFVSEEYSSKILGESSGLMDYDFDFRDNTSSQIHRGGQCRGITEMENPSEEEESMNFPQQGGEFEKQRKEVQRQFFHKQAPQIEWSDEDCQIDLD